MPLPPHDGRHRSGAASVGGGHALLTPPSRWPSAPTDRPTTNVGVAAGFPLDLWRCQGETPRAPDRRQGVEDRPVKGGVGDRANLVKGGGRPAPEGPPALPLAGRPVCCPMVRLCRANAVYGPTDRPPPLGASSALAPECRVDSTEWVDSGRPIGCRPSSGVERATAGHSTEWAPSPLRRARWSPLGGGVCTMDGGPGEWPGMATPSVRWPPLVVRPHRSVAPASAPPFLRPPPRSLSLSAPLDEHPLTGIPSGRCFPLT